MVIVFGLLRNSPVAARAALATLRPFRTFGPFRAIIAFPGPTPRLAVVGLGAVVGFRFDQLFAIVVAIVVTALATLLFEADTALAQDTEIVIRELKEIFCLDAVTRKLGIARHVLVFLKKLRRVAALPVIAGIAAIAGHALGTLTSATTTAAALTIIDQMLYPCRTSAEPAAPCLSYPFNGRLCFFPWKDRTSAGRRFFA